MKKLILAAVLGIATVFGLPAADSALRSIAPEVASATTGMAAHAQRARDMRPGSDAHQMRRFENRQAASAQQSRGACTAQCGGRAGGEAANPPHVIACFRRCMGVQGNSDSAGRRQASTQPPAASRRR